jgi:hypothetical protein
MSCAFTALRKLSTARRAAADPVAFGFAGVADAGGAGGAPIGPAEVVVVVAAREQAVKTSSETRNFFTRHSTDVGAILTDWK